MGDAVCSPGLKGKLWLTLSSSSPLFGLFIALFCVPPAPAANVLLSLSMGVAEVSSFDASGADMAVSAGASAAFLSVMLVSFPSCTRL